jgi:hypothetical protein
MAMDRTGGRSGAWGSLGVVLVEMAYVTLTSGVYAGLQQKALGVRSRLLGNGIIVFGVPWLAQAFDWLAHRAAGAPATPQATVAMLLYATLSALFHLYAMRRGAFLTGRKGRPLGNDFRQMPRLIGGFVLTPVVLISAVAARWVRVKGVEAAY